MFARHARLVRLLVALVLAVWLWPLSAHGLSGPIALGFAASYAAPDGTSCTHRGIDVSLPGGSSVDAPRAGTVRFAGRVPGPHGGSVLAITLDTAEGAITMLPFAAVGVEAGQRLEAGEKIGDLADAGDPSSAGSHVHLGLKRGGVYLDPSILLATPAPAADPQPEEQTAENPLQAPVPSAAGAVGVASPSGAVTVVSPSAAGAPAAAPSAATAVAAGSSAAPAPDGLPSGVTLADASTAPKVGTVRVVAVDERLAQASAPRSARISRPALTPGLLALIASALSASCFLVPLLLTRRAIASRVVSPPVSDRFGILLQHLKAGDTLRGLTSCPGPLPSQSRGH